MSGTQSHQGIQNYVRDMNADQTNAVDEEANQRQQFIDALKNTISEQDFTQTGKKGFAATGEVVKTYTGTDCLDITGKFTSGFEKELREIADGERPRLEALGNRVASLDNFGVLRRQCEACLEHCRGYQPQGASCPSDSAQLDFPTFCQNCGCPARFHSVVKSNTGLSKPQAMALTNFSFTQSELNFNAILAVFEICKPEVVDGNKPVVDVSKNVGALVALLRSEGIEVVSLEIRSFNAQEAMFLRNRQLSILEQEMSLLVNQGFDNEQEKRATQIKSDGSDAFAAATRGDLTTLEKEVKAKTQSIQRKRDRIMGNSKTNTSSKSKMKENQNTSNQSKSPRSQQASRDTWGRAENDDEESSERSDFIRTPLQASIGARGANKWLSLATKAESEAQAGYSDISSGRAVEKLAEAITTSPEIANMMVQPHLVLVLSSSSQQQLGARLTKELIPSFERLDGQQVLRATYVSARKSEAAEDTVTFAPQLFRLQKSVILSEPTEPLLPSHGAASGRAATPRQAALGEGSYTSLAAWRAEADKVYRLANEARALLQSKQGSAADANDAGKLVEMQADLDKLEKRQLALLRLKPRGDAKSGPTTALTQAVTNLVRGGHEGAGSDQNQQRSVNQLQAADYTPQDTQWSDRDPRTNRVLRNYGTMLDFFDYSGVAVQESQSLVDVTRPPSHGFALQRDEVLAADYDERKATQLKGGRALPQQCNLFSIASVGTPNMIFPSTLDVALRNFQDQEAYLQLCDHFFPENVKSQLTVIVIRPAVVQNGLNDLFVAILEANDFLVLERQRRVLTQQEASYLCKLENTSKGNIELALDYSRAGPSEILVVSKLGAVQDARTLCHGSVSGRRRTSLVDESSGSSRSNVDSLNAMFEVAPFSSFNEFIDLQDFLVQHSRLHKYKQKGTRQDASESAKALDALAVQKIEEIRLELSPFQRSFALAAVAAPSEAEAQKQINLFCPRVAAVEEVVFVLNPHYNDRLPEAEALLVRMQYRFVKLTARVLTGDEAQRLLGDKFGSDASDPDSALREDGGELISAFTGREVHVFHLSKTAADKEARALFARGGAILEDHVFASPIVTEETGQFMPKALPFLFLFMDSDPMFEVAIELLYGSVQSSYTASDFISSGELQTDAVSQKVLETCLCTTVGESILRVVFDNQGQYVPKSQLTDDPKYKYSHCSLSTHFRSKQYKLSAYQAGWREATAFELFWSPKKQGEVSVSFVLEGESHKLFEVRIHKIQHKGDTSVDTGFALEGVDMDDGTQSMATQSNQSSPQKGKSFGKTKKVTFVGEARTFNKPSQSKEMQEIRYFFEKFQALNFYYSQVSKRHGSGLVPSFYTFKIFPLNGPKLNRVFEVEEYVGKCFIDEVAAMHLADKQQMQPNQGARTLMKEAQLGGVRTQKSLPAFVIGRLMALLCKKLEDVQCTDQSVLQGAGELIYSRSKAALRGRVKDVRGYYRAECERYKSMRSTIESRWLLYISSLESEIIDEKLDLILESLTFKFTRQPGLLSLVPDRLTEGNVRITSTVKLQNDGDNDKDKERKFYKDISDPQRSQDLEEVVGSVLNTINKQQSDEIQNSSSNKKYSITKYVSISGVEPAKRSKYQLIASMLYLVNFRLRKVNRRTDLFVGAAGGLGGPDADQVYDDVLDAVIEGINENYGDNEVNHVLDLVALNRGGQGSALEAVLRAKLETTTRAQEKRTRLSEMAGQKRRGTVRMAREQEQAAMKGDRRVGDGTAGGPARPLTAADRRDAEELIALERAHAGRVAAQAGAQKSLQSFLSRRTTSTLSGTEVQEFRTLLASTKTKLGAHAVQLAESVLLKTRLEAARPTGRTGLQEKLSFVKVEYFLCAYREAHRLMMQLQSCGEVLFRCEDGIEQCQREIRMLVDKGAVAEASLAGARNSQLTQAQRQMAVERTAINAQITSFEREQAEARYSTAQREVELIAVLRELASCEIHAPDDHFDGDRLLRQGKEAEIAGVAEEYKIPLKTFWIPLELTELEGSAARQGDPHSKYSIAVREAAGLDKTIRDEEAQGKQSHERYMKNIDRQLVNDAVTNLRPRKQDAFLNQEHMTLRKLTFPAFANEQEELDKLSKKLHTQTTGFSRAKQQEEQDDDPFRHLRNKEKADTVIVECIEHFFNYDSAIGQRAGLPIASCEQLTKKALQNMRDQNVKVNDFDDLGFETSFRIYANRKKAEGAIDTVEKSQLKNFVKSALDL